MFLYNLVVFLYGVVIRIASLNNPKAKLWVSGRKNWRLSLEEKISRIKNESNLKKRKVGLPSKGIVLLLDLLQGTVSVKAQIDYIN